MSDYSDSLLLNDTQLHCNGKYYMTYSCLLTNFVSILDSRESDETNDSFYSPQTTSSSGNSSINISLSTSEALKFLIKLLLPIAKEVPIKKTEESHGRNVQKL